MHRQYRYFKHDLSTAVHHNEITFSLVYAFFSENFQLPSARRGGTAASSSACRATNGSVSPTHACSSAMLFTLPGTQLLFMAANLPDQRMEYREPLEWWLTGR